MVDGEVNAHGRRSGGHVDRLCCLPTVAGQQSAQSPQTPNPAQKRYPYPVVRDMAATVPPGPTDAVSSACRRPLGAPNHRSKNIRVSLSRGIASLRLRVPPRGEI